MGINPIVFGIFLLLSTNSYAGLFCDTPSELEKKLRDKSFENISLKQSKANLEQVKIDLEQRLSQSQKEIKTKLAEIDEKNLLISRYQGILDDKNTVARNMQFNSNGVHWSWISLCDSLHLTEGVNPLCRFSRAEVDWANRLVAQGLPPDIQSNYRRLIVHILMYSALGFIFICILLGFSYYLFKSFLGQYKDPLRYQIDARYHLEVNQSFEMMRDEQQMRLNKLQDECSHVLKHIEFSEGKLKKLNKFTTEKEKEIESLNVKAETLKMKAQKIIEEEIEVISSAVSSDIERRELIRRKLSG